MVKFLGALSLLAAVSVSDAAFPASLIKQSRLSTQTNPVLKRRALKRGHGMQQKIRDMAQKAPRRLDDGGYYNYNQNNYNGNAQQYNGGDGNYNYNANQNYDYQWNNNGWNGGDYNDQAQQQAQNDWDNWENSWYWDEEMEQEEFGFPISQYAMKFEQCATIASYNDELAENEYSDTVLAAQRFAIFRLCPANTCQDGSGKSGCSQNYGEYIVGMDQYLAAVMEEEEERVIEYCNYCQECASIESAKYFWREVDYRRQAALAQAEEAYETWIASYQEQVQEQQNAYQDGYMNNNMYNNYNNANYNAANGNGYNQGNNANGDEAMEENDLAQRYYSYLRDKSDYANNYYKNNYNQNVNGYNSNGQSNGQNVNGQDLFNGQWTNQYFWNLGQQSQTQNKNKQNWDSMGSNGMPAFYGKKIQIGYFDQNGDFVMGWGFFNSNGQYVFLENEEQMEWDYNMWGEQPDTWDGITLDTESCNSQYSSSCYNQYDACMVVLKDYDYWLYKASENGEYYQDGDQGGEPMTLKEFMTCSEYEVVVEGNDYANQEYYAQKYQAKQEYIEQEYNCYEGDEQCEAARDYALAKYEYQMQKQMDRKYYIGPHCSSNGHDITLAVYKDEYCSVMDSENSVEDLLGYDPIESIDLVPDDCIACGITEEMMEEKMWYEDEDYDYDQIEPMCSMLYQLSGKCNENMNVNMFNGNNANNYYEEQDWEQMYLSEQQKANEEHVCSYIESLKSNTYDEYGEVVLSNSAAWMNPAQWGSEFQSESRAMSPGLKASITLLTIAVAVMGVWACFLHGTLARKNIPWRPRRKVGEDPTDIARQSSGIVMGRSRSGQPGTEAPLI